MQASIGMSQAAGLSASRSRFTSQHVDALRTQLLALPRSQRRAILRSTARVSAHKQARVGFFLVTFLYPAHLSALLSITLPSCNVVPLCHELLSSVEALGFC